MNKPDAQKLAEWRARASQKDAIVPHFFEVFPTKVIVVCGHCQSEFRRNLVPNVNEPTFICPECSARNWVPVRYDLKY